MKILKDYKLIFGTLSAVGHQIISNSNINFDTVIIDEAGQSIEIENLIPLIYGCKRLILIGDPNQLPATVFSKMALDLNYDQSLFERMMKCNYPVNVLKVQYRMHP
jgi:senataxin